MQDTMPHKNVQEIWSFYVLENRQQKTLPEGRVFYYCRKYTWTLEPLFTVAPIPGSCL